MRSIRLNFNSRNCFKCRPENRKLFAQQTCLHLPALASLASTCLTCLHLPPLATLASLASLPFGPSCLWPFWLSQCQCLLVTNGLFHSFNSRVRIRAPFIVRSWLENSINTDHADALAKLPDRFARLIRLNWTHIFQRHFCLPAPFPLFPLSLSSEVPSPSLGQNTRRSPILAAINYAWFDSLRLRFALLCFALLWFSLYRFLVSLSGPTARRLGSPALMSTLAFWPG